MANRTTIPSPTPQETAAFWSGFKTVFALSFLTLYLSLVHFLRYMRHDKTKFLFPTRSSLARMSLAQAQEIVILLAQYEFPLFHHLGLQFALFRTYGIPSISGLLEETGVFAKPETAGKRYADTVCLVAEQIGRRINGPLAGNWVQATARMNCIHKTYQDQGKISDEDMLYTLALFAREPMVWIERYDWRKLSDVEKCALGVFWQNQGDAMGISWTGLPTYDKGQKWQDGLQFLEEWLEWTEVYEKRHMVPANSNFELAEQTTKILLWPVPEFAKGSGKMAVHALMDDRLRIAMKYPPASAGLRRILDGVFWARAVWIRNFCLPRFEWFNKYTAISDSPDENGRMYALIWDALPYYVKPTLWNRYGLRSIITRICGLPVPGDEGARFCPMGYSIPDLGPGHGKKEQAAMEEKVRSASEKANSRFAYSSK